MKFKMVHNNFNVLDLEKSLKFYRDAFDMHEVRRIEAKDGSFIIVYLEDGNSSHQLELTWLRDRKEPYNLGDNEFHLAFKVDDYEAAMPAMRRWAASATKIPRWGSTFAKIQIHTGSRLSRRSGNGLLISGYERIPFRWYKQNDSSC